MFTGIVEAMAPIKDISLSRLEIEIPVSFTDIRLGSSIAVNGCCLTVSGLSEKVMSFDLTRETIEKTNFGAKKVGDLVNLERAVPTGGRLDGHVVQGHVEGTGEIVECSGESLKVRIPNEFKDSVLDKGSIAIDGISLTIASIDQNLLTFAIIPFTNNHTIIHAYKEGDSVNIETDVLSKYARFS